SISRNFHFPFSPSPLLCGKTGWFLGVNQFAEMLMIKTNSEKPARGATVTMPSHTFQKWGKDRHKPSLFNGWWGAGPSRMGCGASTLADCAPPTGTGGCGLSSLSELLLTTDTPSFNPWGLP
ncbi:MAG: hypothetical protein ACPIOQ_37510, partial [Promethearchaeia archaeon]